MNRQVKIGGVLIVFCLILWFFLIPAQTKGPKEAFFPKVITIWLGSNGIFITMNSLLKRSKSPNKINLSEKYGKSEILKIIFIMVFFFIYIIMVYLIGFILPSFLFLIFIMLFLGIRNWKILFLIPTVCILMIYVLIEAILQFPLPKGIFFRFL